MILLNELKAFCFFLHKHLPKSEDIMVIKQF